jgi:hypothetical protein
MKTELGLRTIRRKTSDGWHFFIANLTPNDINGDVALAIPFKGATWFNPMNGDIYPADVCDGKLHINLRSGESRILQTSSTQSEVNQSIQQKVAESFEVKGPWSLSFIDECPRVEDTFQLDTLQTWETLSDSAAITMGTGVYATTFKLSGAQAKKHWLIDLGDVRESARVYLNGQFIGCAWAVPFVLDCGNALQKGTNQLRIEVTNLPANRIAHLDRQGIPWRKFNEINVVDINYKKTTYAHWSPVPSGLRSKVTLVEKINQ